jgi:hypothetical protein
MNTDPVAVSIVLSDSVICEHGTGKNSLIGCFNNFNVPQFPFPTPVFYITAAVTNLSPALKKFDIAVFGAKTGQLRGNYFDKQCSGRQTAVVSFSRHRTR